MKITVTMKPTKITSPTKEGVFQKSGLSGMIRTFGTYGGYYTHVLRKPECEQYAYVYTLEKHRKKYKQFKRKIKNPSKDSPFDMITHTLSKKVRDKQWIMHLYKIDLKLLEVTGLKVSQKERTFVLEKK